MSASLSPQRLEECREFWARVAVRTVGIKNRSLCRCGSITLVTLPIVYLTVALTETTYSAIKLRRSRQIVRVVAGRYSGHHRPTSGYVPVATVINSERPEYDEKRLELRILPVKNHAHVVIFWFVDIFELSEG